MNIFYYALLTPLLGGAMSLICSEKIKLKIVSFFTFISMILCLMISGKVLISGESLVQNLTILNGMFGAVKFVIDPLSAFFISVISVMSFFATVYY